MRDNRCPICKINLDGNYNNISIKDSNILSLKLLFGEVEIIEADSIKNFCPLCRATVSEIMMDRLAPKI